jgi:hypothetical protein
MRTLVLAVVVALAGAIALPADADARKFRARQLGECISTIEQWRAAPIGAWLPVVGARFYKRDRQRGYSVTYCLTARKERQEPEVVDRGSFQEYLAADPHGSTWQPARFGRGLRRNVESVRLATAPGCILYVGLLDKQKRPPYPYLADSFGWGRRWSDGIVKLDREVPPRYDDKATRWVADYACGDGKYHGEES